MKGTEIEVAINEKSQKQERIKPLFCDYRYLLHSKATNRLCDMQKSYLSFACMAALSAS